MKQAQQPKPKKVHVAFEIQGAEVDRFLNYKQESFLRNNSEAGRKLMLERLSQIEAEKATQAPAVL